MRIITLSLLLCGLVIQSFGVRPPLKGYTYASEQAPTGKEWQSPENLALNKEQPHAWFFPFQDIKSARKVLPENSIYWQSLNVTGNSTGQRIRIHVPKIFIKPIST